MHESFVSLLSTLAPVLGLPEISVREDDPSCLLTIDDFEISLRYFPVSDLVMLSTVAAPLPARGRKELFAALLDANTFFHGTQGFTLAAPEDTGVTLQGVMPLRMLDGANITVWVQNFINMAEHWQEKCLKYDAGTETAEPAPLPFQQGMLRV